MHAKMTCIAVPGATVTAGDLQAAVPALRSLLPEQPLFPAPAIGLIRRVTARDLRTYVDDTASVPPDTCVERSGWQPGADEMKAAMLAALPVAPRLLELVEVSRYAIPKGRLEFSLDGLKASVPLRANEVLLWNGRVVPLAGPAVRIWARVRLVIVGPSLRLKRALAAGEPLRAEDLARESGLVSVRELKDPPAAGELAGCTVTRPLAMGDPLTKSDLRCVATNQARPVEAFVRVGNVLIKVAGTVQGSIENTAECRFQAKGMKKVVAARAKSHGVVEVVVP